MRLGLLTWARLLKRLFDLDLEHCPKGGGELRTIADFRGDNGDAIRKVCKEFVLLCRRLKQFTDGIVIASCKPASSSLKTASQAPIGRARPC